VVVGLSRLFPSSPYILLAISYMVGLELIFALQRWVILVAVVVVFVVTLGIILVGYEERGSFRPTQVILPFLAIVGLSGFAFLLPTSNVLHLYILAAGLVLFSLLKHGARAAYPLWNWTLSLGIYFLNVAFILGLRWHLLDGIPILLLLMIVFVVTVLMSGQALCRISTSLTDVVLPVLALSFGLTEIVWVLQFLPSHYLAQAGIVTVLYYVTFSLISLSFTRKLVMRDFGEYVGIGSLAALIIIISARWT